VLPLLLLCATPPAPAVATPLRLQVMFLPVAPVELFLVVAHLVFLPTLMMLFDLIIILIFLLHLLNYFLLLLILSSSPPS
jgi:hypothetical protein